MRFIDAFRTALFILFLMVIPIPSATQDSQKGIITKAAGSQDCDLKSSDNGYHIANCGDFQTGQEVNYWAKEGKVVVVSADGKQRNCKILATFSSNNNPAQAPVFQKGTIEGYEIRYLTSEGGMGGVRKVKAYDLRGADSLYQIAFCGSFEAGQFSAGQFVEYQVVGDRLNILHDNKKEWSCQIVGKVKAEDAVAAQPAAPSSASATAKLSITSNPDGADIEVDGNFSGNAPSDLTVPEGEHAITMKKSGYKDWVRKMKVSAGSNVRLNAEMEKLSQ